VTAGDPAGGDDLAHCGGCLDPEARPLGGTRRAAAGGGPDRIAEDAHGAGLRTAQADDQAQQGRLPPPFGPATATNWPSGISTFTSRAPATRVVAEGDPVELER
jgi:hypothetical protein